MPLNLNELPGLPEAGDPAALIAQLGVKYKFDKKIVDVLVGIGYTSAEEFAVAMSDDNAIAKVVDTAKLSSELASLNFARLKIAKSQINTAAAARELARSKPPPGLRR